MDVRAYLAESAQRVDRHLDAALPGAAQPPARLHAAMRHLLFPGGKRLRPALAFAGAEAVGGAPESALPVAAAVELIHTYSLVHDDLPCMDDDDERRGRPTVHVAYDEVTAVLAGDALQAAAFGALADCEPARVAAVLGDLAHAVGAAGLVGGQYDDLFFAGDDASLEDVESVHERKSAALIAAAVVGGARVAGADDARCERLRRFALRVGVAFQIADDLLDADEPEPCTIVGKLGVEGARERAEALLVEALAEVESLGQPAEALRELARFSVRRDR
jgi:geranylgeranyl pyrophosphate synthase